MSKFVLSRQDISKSSNPCAVYSEKKFRYGWRCCWYQPCQHYCHWSVYTGSVL